jgi:hypothetical protein
MKFSPLIFSAAMGLTVLSAPAFADDMNKPAPRCFSMQEFQDWKAPDARTIYVRAGVSQYYRLDLSAPCQSLMFPDSHLITKVRGSDQVCSGIDWDLSVSNSTGLNGGAGFKEACIVKTQTPLSPADVAQIPKKFKP